MKSVFLGLNLKDGVKGLLLAVITAVLTVVYTSLEAGSLSFDWAAIGKVALLTTVSYALKNWLTNSNDEFLKKES